MENFPGNILLCLYFICSLIINNFEALYSQTILSTLNGEVIILMMVVDFVFFNFCREKKNLKKLFLLRKKIIFENKIGKIYYFPWAD